MRWLRTLMGSAVIWSVGLAGATEINQASEAALDGVRGIGPALSGRIIEERTKKPFAHWDDLIARIPGIGRVRAAQLSAEGLRVEGESYHLPGAPVVPAAPAMPKAPPAPPKPPMPTPPVKPQ